MQIFARTLPVTHPGDGNMLIFNFLTFSLFARGCWSIRIELFLKVLVGLSSYAPYPM